jgi:thioesterase domain-containing protein
MATFIMVPEGWQGGSAFGQVAGLHVSQGHRAQPLTLAGLGDAHAPSANLAHHIGKAVHAVRACRDEVVLVGHSYAGMVVSGAADADPGWKTFSFDCGHNIPRLQPQAFVEILWAHA